MRCERCGERPATVHLAQIVNGKKREQHLCEVCARESGELGPWQEPFSIHHLLAGLLQPGPGGIPVAGSRAGREGARCPKCGLALAEFGETGLLGCEACYAAFQAELEPIFRRVHGATRHEGKLPQRAGGALRREREIGALRRELQRAIEREEFERAAELRDRIRAIEGAAGGSGEGRR